MTTESRERLRTAITTRTQRSVRSKFRLQYLDAGYSWHTKTSYRRHQVIAYSQLASMRARGQDGRLVDHYGIPIAHNTDLDIPGIEAVK